MVSTGERRGKLRVLRIDVNEAAANHANLRVRQNAVNLFVLLASLRVIRGPFGRLDV